MLQNQMLRRLTSSGFQRGERFSENLQVKNHTEFTMAILRHSQEGRIVMVGKTDSGTITT